MTDRFQTELQLSKQSLAIIQQKKSLLIFPIAHVVINLLLLATVLAPLITLEKTAWEIGKISEKSYFIFFMIVLLYFAVTNLITLIFNAALSFCAIQHIQNKPYTIGGGLKTALSRVATLYCWKVLMVTFGAYVRFSEYWLDDWPTSSTATNVLCGVRWRIAVLFIVPVLIIENLGPWNAVKRSAQLLKNTWGTSLIYRARANMIVFIISLIALLPFFIGLFVGHETAITLGTSVSAVLLIIITVFHSATQIILVSALYLFANGVDASRYYDTALLKEAFRSMGKK